MTEATPYLLSLARQIARPYTTLPQLRAFMVTGSVAKGEADFYSDLDMTAIDTGKVRKRLGWRGQLWRE